MRFDLLVFDFDGTLVSSADRVTHQKPAPALYARHIAPVFPGIPRNRTLVVGDTEPDLRFAANIGVASCWATYGYGDVPACRALEPTFEIASIGELLDVLQVQGAPPGHRTL